LVFVNKNEVEEVTQTAERQRQAEGASATFIDSLRKVRLMQNKG
jgi:hypothetical protein